MMSVQPLLPFEDVPVTDPTQARYHAIAPCLGVQKKPVLPNFWCKFMKKGTKILRDFTALFNELKQGL